MPDWVRVWFWLRFIRSPHVLTPLPQQGINIEAMSMDSYELYEAEWQEIGAPTTSAQQILLAMGASKQADLYDDIPF